MGRSQDNCKIRWKTKYSDQYSPRCLTEHVDCLIVSSGTIFRSYLKLYAAHLPLVNSQLILDMCTYKSKASMHLLPCCTQETAGVGTPPTSRCLRQLLQFASWVGWPCVSWDGLHADCYLCTLNLSPWAIPAIVLHPDCAQL